MNRVVSKRFIAPLRAASSNQQSDESISQFQHHKASSEWVCAAVVSWIQHIARSTEPIDHFCTVRWWCAFSESSGFCWCNKITACCCQQSAISNQTRSWANFNITKQAANQCAQRLSAWFSISLAVLNRSIIYFTVRWWCAFSESSCFCWCNTITHCMMLSASSNQTRASVNFSITEKVANECAQRLSDWFARSTSSIFCLLHSKMMVRVQLVQSSWVEW